MTTNSEIPSIDDLISHFSHQPYEAREGMIRIPQNDIPKPSSVSSTQSSASSLGRLSKLPVELMHHVVNELDFLSLSRFSQACLAANEILQSLPSYRDMMQYAPETLAALSRTQLISHHSAATLHTALQSPRCISCKEYGTFLFLPTCERCCWLCLGWNQALRVIPAGTAAKCFHLTPREVKQLPVMLSLPGRYHVLFYKDRPKRHKLVSVKAAKKLALAIHGSEQEYAKAVAIPPRHLSPEQLLQFRRFQNAPLEHLNHDVMVESCRGDRGDDIYCGVATISFPSISNQRTENGLWCRGCDWTFRNYDYGNLSEQFISRLVPDTQDPTTYLRAMSRWTRSPASFLNHIKDCFGVRPLAHELGLQNWMETLKAVQLAENPRELIIR